MHYTAERDNTDTELIVDFDQIAEKGDSSLMIDSTNGIIRINWIGIVTAEIASHIFASAVMEIKHSNVSKLILDGKYLELYTKGARLWIKEDFFNNRGKAGISNIEKVATVKPHSDMAHIYANLVNSSIKIAFPAFTMSEYATDSEAVKWLINE